MKVTYRGHEIDVERHGPTIYYSVFSEDGYECLTSFCETTERLPSFLRHMKNRVDEELHCEDPWGRNG